MVDTIVTAFELYWLLGLLFAIWFAAVGAGRLDPAARTGTWGFRILVVPGAAALWPWLLARLLRGGPNPPEEHNAHRDRARPGRAR